MTTLALEKEYVFFDWLSTTNFTYNDFKLSISKPKEAQHIDKLLIWGFGRLIHNSLEARMNQEFYFSNSRAYSVSAQRWTAPDPLLMWGPKSLVGTYGNWHPYLYCHDNPINFVDPSGYASFSVNYSNRSRVNGTFITKGVKTATSFAIGAAYNNAARTSFGLGVGAGELVKNNFRLAALGGTVAGSVGATALNMGVKTVLVGTAFTVGQKIGNVFGAAIDTLVDNAQGSANDFFSKMMNSTGATDVLYDVGFGSGFPNFDFQDHNSSPSSDFWNSNPYSTDN